MLDGGMCSLFTKEYGSQCSLRYLNVKQIYADDIISRSRREEIKTTIEKAKLGHHVKLRTHSCGEHDIMMTIDCV